MLRRLASLKWLALWISCAICYLPLTLIGAIVQPRRPGAPPPRPALLWIMLACAALLSLPGCAGAARGRISKILTIWDDVCDVGRATLQVAVAVETRPADAGAADASEGGAP
jgi:hypothetical protein